MSSAPDQSAPDGPATVSEGRTTRRTPLRRGRARTWELVAAFSFGVVFLGIMLAVAILIPRPTEFQIFVFRVVLALAAAGFGAVVPGFIVVNVSRYIRAGGALALFVIVFAFNPPALVTGFTAFDEAMRRAEATLSDDNHTAALEFFEKAHQADPQSWKPYHGLGRVEYQRGNLTVALDRYRKAFELQGEKDGSLAYSIALLQDGLEQHEEAAETLKVAARLLPESSPLANDVVFDRGLINLILWLKEDAPGASQRYTVAELAFRNFLERGGRPAHWARYHGDCLKASRAEDPALPAAQAAALKAEAAEDLERAVAELAAYRSTKAPAQREMMRRVLTEPEKWARGPGEPAACPALVRAWTHSRGTIEALTAQLG